VGTRQQDTRAINQQESMRFAEQTALLVDTYQQAGEVASSARSNADYLAKELETVEASIRSIASDRRSQENRIGSAEAEIAYLRANGTEVYRYALQGDSEDSYFGDFIEDDDVDSPVASATQEMLKERIDMVLKTLSYREREIIKLRYGIGDGYTYTLEEVGRIFKVTRERVRQVEAKAIRKLQHPVRARKLEGFLDHKSA